MISKMGLIGLYQSSNLREDISSVYMISDEDTKSLYVFILFPGSYHDVYEIASLTTYVNIFLVPISLDPAYISDVYRLVNELHPIKSIVKVINPRKFTSQNCNTLFLNSFVKGNDKSSFVYSSNGFIAFNWKDDETNYPPRLNDIYCTFGDRRVLLTSTKVDKDRILKLFTDDLLDYVYVPWSRNPEWNSAETDNFLSLIDYDPLKPYMAKIVPYGFSNQTEIDLCEKHFPDNFPVTIRHLFIATTKEDEFETIVTWGEARRTPHVPPFKFNCCCDKNPPPPPFPCLKPIQKYQDGAVHIDSFGNVYAEDGKMYISLGCGCCQPKPPKPEFWPDATDLAIGTIADYCKGFKDFAEKCDIGCENCKIKSYFDVVKSSDSTDDDSTDTSTDDDKNNNETGDTTDKDDKTAEGNDTTTTLSNTNSTGSVEDLFM